VKVVTEADKKKLEELALAQLKQQAPTALLAALKSNEFVRLIRCWLTRRIVCLTAR